MSLARQLAADGRRVLLIDADLKRPRALALLGDTRELDLVDLLAERAELDEVLRRDPASGAYYLGARRGVAGTRALLESRAMHRLMLHAREAYDVVIVDTPPLSVAADAALVARDADACLYCVRWGSTPRDMMLQGLRLLALCQIRVTGIVMSQVDTRRHRGYGYPQGQLMPPRPPQRLADVTPGLEAPAPR